MQHVTFIVALK